MRVVVVKMEQPVSDLNLFTSLERFPIINELSFSLAIIYRLLAISATELPLNLSDLFQHLLYVLVHNDLSWKACRNFCVNWSTKKQAACLYKRIGPIACVQWHSPIYVPLPYVAVGQYEKVLKTNSSYNVDSTSNMTRKEEGRDITTSLFPLCRNQKPWAENCR